MRNYIRDLMKHRDMKCVLRYEMIDAAHIRENLQKIDQLRQLQSLVELAELLDDVACLSRDYRFYMNIGGSYHCLKFLNFQQVTVNLNFSTDLLFKVATVSDYFSMNSEGRMSFVGQMCIRDRIMIVYI